MTSFQGRGSFCTCRPVCHVGFELVRLEINRGNQILSSCRRSANAQGLSGHSTFRFINSRGFHHLFHEAILKLVSFALRFEKHRLGFAATFALRVVCLFRTTLIGWAHAQATILGFSDDE